MEWYNFLGPLGSGIGAAIDKKPIMSNVFKGLFPMETGLASLMRPKKAQAPTPWNYNPYDPNMQDPGVRPPQVQIAQPPNPNAPRMY